MRKVSWVARAACVWRLVNEMQWFKLQESAAGMASAGNSFDWNKMLCSVISTPWESPIALLLYLTHFIITFFVFFFLFLFVECSWDQRTQKVRPFWPIYQCQGVYFAVSISLHHYSKLQSCASRCNVIQLQLIPVHFAAAWEKYDNLFTVGFFLQSSYRNII